MGITFAYELHLFSQICASHRVTKIARNIVTVHDAVSLREHPNNLYLLAQVQIPFHYGRAVIEVCCIYNTGIICAQQYTREVTLSYHDLYILGNRYP